MTIYPLTIAFNGPPGSGKDHGASLAQAMLTEAGYPSQTVRLAEPLIKAVEAFYDLPWAQYKDILRPKAIRMAEDYYWPTFGKEGFARRVQANKIAKFHGISLITDLGTQAEFDYFASRCPKNFYVLQITRDDCTFDQDNRQYVGYGYPNTFAVTNDETYEDKLKFVLSIILEKASV